MQPVVVRGPTGPAGHASAPRTMARLVVPLHPDAATLASPLPRPTLRRLDDVLTDARPLPARPAAALAGAVSARLDHARASRAIAADEPLPVAPGSLGMWFDDDTEAPGA